MPTFDTVSEVDSHETRNAVDQANRELATRFDFKGADASFELTDMEVMIAAEAEFQLQQMLDILKSKLVARKIDVGCLDLEDPFPLGKQMKQKATLRQGVDTDSARKIVKILKGSKLKVQAAIQGDKVRVTGKKRDDLQQAMQLLREQELDVPLQFNNFRD